MASHGCCLLLLLACQMAYGFRPFAVKFLSYEQTYSKDFYHNITLRLLNYNGKRVLNGSAFLKRVIDDFDFGFRIASWSRKNNTKTLLNVRLNACQLFGTPLKKGFDMVYTITRALKSKSHILPDQCPIKKDHDYYVKYFAFEPEMFPVNLPPTKLLVNIRYIYKNIDIYNSTFGVAVTRVSNNARGSF